MRKNLTGFAILMILSACGLPSFPMGGSSTQDGTYSSGCVVVSTNSDLQTYVIDGDTLSGTDAVYTGNTSCDASALFGISNWVYDISTGTGVVTPEGDLKFELDMSLATTSFAPGGAALANALNSISYCGLTNWQAGVASDITGRNCAGTTLSAGTMTYSLIKTNSDGLYLGTTTTDSDGTSVEERYTELTGPFPLQAE